MKEKTIDREGRRNLLFNIIMGDVICFRNNGENLNLIIHNKFNCFK